MVILEDLQRGIAVRGVLADYLVTVVNAKRYRCSVRRNAVRVDRAISKAVTRIKLLKFTRFS